MCLPDSSVFAFVSKGDSSQPMLASLQSVLALLVLLLAAFGLGRPLLRGMGVAQEDGLEVAVWSLTLGMTIASLVLAMFGLLGWLYQPVLGVFTLSALAWGAGELVKGTARSPAQQPSGGTTVSALEAPSGSVGSVPGFVMAAVWTLAAMAAGSALVSALAPPSAGDAMCYHLQLPKHYLQVHHLEHLPLSDNSTYPLLVEMLYLWGLATEGGVTAQLIHWSWGILLAGSSVLLARPLVGNSLAWLAGALVLLVPGVTNQMAAPLNDVALAATCQLALLAWFRAFVRGESSRHWILCGWMLGASLAIKYTALLLLPAIGGVSLFVMIQRRERTRAALAGALAALVVAASVSGVWYVRATWHRGNPVYPFLGSVFDTAGRDIRRESKLPLPLELLSVAAAPWHVTFDPDRFGGSGHQLGAAFLALLPGLLIARRLRGLGILMAVAVLYMAQWYLLRQNVRFLLVVVPPLAVAGAWCLSEWSRWPQTLARGAYGMLLLLLATQAMIPLYRARTHVAVATGFETRASFLAKHEPVWEIAQLVPQVFTDPQHHLLSQDFRMFYLDCRITREVEYRRESAYHQDLQEPGELANQLTAAGFTHVLLAQPVGPGRRYNKTLLRLVWQARQARPESLQTLATVTHEDARGHRRRYDQIELRPSALAPRGDRAVRVDSAIRY